ncbi:unnamed protein product, partial [Ectocarpus sp. 4 AP-2014]
GCGGQERISDNRGRLYPVQGEAFHHGASDGRRHDSQQQRGARNFWHVGRDRDGRNRLGAHPWVSARGPSGKFRLSLSYDVRDLPVSSRAYGDADVAIPDGVRHKRLVFCHDSLRLRLSSGSHGARRRRDGNLAGVGLARLPSSLNLPQDRRVLPAVPSAEEPVVSLCGDEHLNLALSTSQAVMKNREA